MTQESNLAEIREKIANLEHEQWVTWSKEIAKVPISQLSARFERWKTLWIPYAELSEERKNQDRIWADRVMNIALSEGMKLGREEYIKEIKVTEKQDLEEIEEAVKKRDNMIRTELIGEIEKLRLNDEFHQWYKDILGEDDILIKIVDKIKEKLLEKIRMRNNERN